MLLCSVSLKTIYRGGRASWGGAGVGMEARDWGMESISESQRREMGGVTYRGDYLKT